VSTALYKSDQHQQRTRNEDVQNQPKKDHKQTLNSTPKNDDRNEMLSGWLSVGDVSMEKQNHHLHYPSVRCLKEVFPLKVCACFALSN